MMNAQAETATLDTDYEEEGQSSLEWLQWAVSQTNIAEFLEDDELHTIGSDAQDGYQRDLSSRSEWEETIDEAMKIALQVSEEKSFPWPNASNVKFPQLTTAAIQFASRAYPALIDGQNVVKSKVVGNDPEGQKQGRGDRIGEHMSWQLTEQMEEWTADMDRLLHVIPITGCVFKKTRFDPTLQRNRSELILPKYLVANYSSPSLETAPRISHKFNLYPHQIEERIRSGVYREYIRECISKSDKDDELWFIEQHCRIDLDEDGYAEPYIVTLEEETGKVARVVAGFTLEDVQFNERGEIVKIEPIEFFTKFGFIPNPESGIYDLGFGVLLKPINSTVNTTINQLLDAGTLQNAGGGFIGNALKIRGGTLKFKLGEYKRVDSSGASIRDNIYEKQNPGPSPVLFQLLGLLIDTAKDITSVKDVMTGESGGANASPTTTLAVIEQGLKQFSAITARVHRALKSEFKKLYRLNAIFLNPEEYFTVLDTQKAVSQQDYQQGDMDVVPASDPRVVTDTQKLAKAQVLMSFANDPYFDPKEIRRRYLEAAGIDELEGLIVDPPQPPPDPKVMEIMGELQREGKLAEAEYVKTLAEAAEALAKAESHEAGTQLNIYRAQIESLINGFKSNGGAVQGVAGPSGNGASPQVPSGPLQNPGGNV